MTLYITDGYKAAPEYTAANSMILTSFVSYTCTPLANQVRPPLGGLPFIIFLAIFRDIIHGRLSENVSSTFGDAATSFFHREILCICILCRSTRHVDKVIDLATNLVGIVSQFTTHKNAIN